MDPFTAMGVVSAAVSLLKFGGQVVMRLEELSKVGDMPAVFRDIQGRLPALLYIVQTINRSRNTLPPEIQDTFEIIAERCQKQIEQLEELLLKVTVAHGDSRIKKSWKAVWSLREDARIQKISTSLIDNIQTLTMFRVAPAETVEDCAPRRSSTFGIDLDAAPPSYSELAGPFMVPFARDRDFVGREISLKEIDALFERYGRVSVTGAGGIGYDW